MIKQKSSQKAVHTYIILGEAGVASSVISWVLPLNAADRVPDQLQCRALAIEVVIAF